MGRPEVYVLDAFAFTAYLENEPGAARVEKIIQDAMAGTCTACMSIINLGEVIYTIERKYGVPKAQDTLGLVANLPIEILPADNQTVLAAAHIKANHPISYADAFVVVAAQMIHGIVMTGDPEFEDVTDLVEIEWLKKRAKP